MPIYTSMHGGNYVVVFEDDNDLQVLENIIEKLKPIYPYIRIAHSYNFDNPPSQGIKIEQNIFENTIILAAEKFTEKFDLRISKLCRREDTEQD